MLCSASDPQLKVKQVFTRYRFFHTAQYSLMSILLSKDSIILYRQRLVDKLFEALKNGIFRVVN